MISFACTLTREAFVVRVAAARETLKGIVWKLIDPLREALALRTALLTHPQPYGGMEAELAALIGPGFLVQTPWAQLPHLPRYLVPLCAERGRYYAVDPEGQVLLWEDGEIDEQQQWDSVWDWVEDVWLQGA